MSILLFEAIFFIVLLDHGNIVQVVKNDQNVKVKMVIPFAFRIIERK